MIYLICGLAMAVAFAALWIAGEASRRNDERITAFVQKNFVPMRDELDSLRRDVNAATKAASKAEANTRSIQDGLSRAEVALETSLSQVAALAAPAKVTPKSSARHS
jgi:hypothetical protein